MAGFVLDLWARIKYASDVYFKYTKFINNIHDILVKL